MGSPINSKSIDLEPLKKAATLNKVKPFDLQTNGDGELNFDVNLKRRSAQILVIQPKN